MSTNQNTLRNALDIDAHGVVNSVGDFFIKIWRYNETASSPSPASMTTANAVNVPQSGIYENHPLIPVYGKFRDDPTWDRFMQNIEEYSREIDKAERSRD